MFFITAELNGFCSAINRNRILNSELKILAKIQLDVICAHMVDFCSPGVGGKFICHENMSRWTDFFRKFCPTGQDILSFL